MNHCEQSAESRSQVVVGIKIGHLITKIRNYDHDNNITHMYFSIGKTRLRNRSNTRLTSLLDLGLASEYNIKSLFAKHPLKRFF